MRYPISYQ